MSSLSSLFDLDSLRYALACVLDAEILFYTLVALILAWLVKTEYTSGVHHHGLR